MLKRENPEDPSCVGQKWTEEEEKLLLDELNQNINIETISQLHKRSIGGIHSRRRHIAYQLYLKHYSIQEIVNQTKLEYDCVKEAIDRRERHKSKKEIPVIKSPIPIESEIAEMKQDIKDIKSTIKELSKILKAIRV